MTKAQELLSFIDKSPSAYQAVQTCADMLLGAGYTRLCESDSWALADGGKYFVVRNGTSIIAFNYSAGAEGFNIVSSHSDSPSFRVKPVTVTGGGYSKLWVERYGGAILYSWFDRPLSVAGRVVLRTEKGVEWRNVCLDRDLLTIPSLSIHMNRGVNDGVKINPAKEMLPLYTLDGGAEDLLDDIAEALSVSKGDIISHDLFIYNREKGRTLGRKNELIQSPRLDDLGCVFASLDGFLNARACASTVQVFAVFDNEEVGSDTKQGAASTFLFDTLNRVAGDADRYRRMVDNGFMVSADNAHAIHPNYPEMSDRENAPVLGKGVVIKYNANQKYATDGVSAAIFETVCKRAGVPTQNYCNRADLPGGSTLGSISNTKVSLYTVDIGLPQLAMHSSCETAAAADVDYMCLALAEFYATPLKRQSDSRIDF